MALPQFLASVNSTRAIADLLCGGAIDIDYESALAAWATLTNNDPPTDSTSSTHSCIASIYAAKMERIHSAMRSQTEVARLLAFCTSDSAVLFQDLPCFQEGTRLANSTLTITVGVRLSLPVAVSGLCACGAELDMIGEHALVCRNGAVKRARHTEVNARIRQALQEASFPSVLEPPGMTRTNGKQTDGATILLYERGLPMAWGATIVQTSAQFYSNLTSVTATKRPQP